MNNFIWNQHYLLVKWGFLQNKQYVERGKAHKRGVQHDQPPQRLLVAAYSTANNKNPGTAYYISRTSHLGTRNFLAVLSCTASLRPANDLSEFASPTLKVLCK